MLRVATFRLLQAINAMPPTSSDDYFGLTRFLQVGGLPESGVRSPLHIINMVDSNSIAFDPSPSKLTPVDFAQGLVAAYFCDRGGLKSRVPGLPISAQMPLHVGQKIRYEAGTSLAEMLELNPISSGGEFMPPWLHGDLKFPAHNKPRDLLELILWPWRRLRVFASGITICPGAPIDKTVLDPWSQGKARLKDRHEDADGDVTYLVLNQALPLACWRKSPAC
jgi:hypothetical protein